MSNRPTPSQADRRATALFLLRILVAVFGVLSAGIVALALIRGIPDRPAARAWPLYSLAVLGPYIPWVLACRPPRRRLVLACVALVLLAGYVLTHAVFVDYVSASRGRPPVMPYSALVAGVCLIVQYTAALTALAVWQFAPPGSEPRSGGSR